MRLARFGPRWIALRRLRAAAVDWPLVVKVRRRRLEKIWREAMIELCGSLAAELTAGGAPEEALSRAVATLHPLVASVLGGSQPQRSPAGTSELDPRSGAARHLRLVDSTDRSLSPELRSAPRAAAGTQAPSRTDGALHGTASRTDIPAALDRLSATPGAEGLRLLAAGWRISVERGGTFAAVADRLADSLRDEESHRQEINAQLAGARATARLLAVLPLLGIAMAWALGAQPLSFLFTTLPDLACLLAGLALDAAGLAWTQRIAHSAENPT